MTKREQLDELNKYWQEHCECELRKTATQAVFGDGNAESEIVFIGEAPGKNEDIEGRPFVGSAGKFFEEMLEGIGMKRSDIYITNIVKYRPPNNRDPEPDEKETCNEWLINELKIISPKLIVFLGRHSMGRFFPAEKISDIHGKLLIKNTPELGRMNFLALYHPAAALYNGGMRETLIKDFNKIPKALEKIKSS
ncbi:MAG TPA: uracil-DNA glycosylase [Candidatus Paceibacterota bacterium]|nr:uracil-DNA glycosylase [Candidatus Paceibacterota bacterium]